MTATTTAPHADYLDAPPEIRWTGRALAGLPLALDRLATQVAPSRVWRVTTSGVWYGLRHECDGRRNLRVVWRGEVSDAQWLAVVREVQTRFAALAWDARDESVPGERRVVELVEPRGLFGGGEVAR